MTTAPRMAKTSPVFSKLYSRAELAAMTTRQRNQYELSLKHYWDMLADRETTRNQLKRERAEGRAEGEVSKALSIATNLLAMGMTIEQITQVTGLTPEEINASIPCLS